MGEGESATQTLTGGLNYGIKQWRKSTEDGGLGHTDYHEHYYVYQPATYPKLNE